MILGLSGPLRKEGISKDSVIACIETLANNDGISGRTDIQKAISVVEETFKKDITAVSGKKYFQLNVLLPATGNYQITTDILGKIFKVVRDIQDQRNRKDDIETEDDIQWLRRNVMAEYVIHTTPDEGVFIYNEERGVYIEYPKKQEWPIKAFCQSISHDVKSSSSNEDLVSAHTDRWIANQTSG